MTIEERKDYVAKAQAFNRERALLAEEYVAGLRNEELAALCNRHMPSSEKKKAPLARITGREHPETLDEAPRKALLLLRRRIWNAAKEPGKSEALKKWENYE